MATSCGSSLFIPTTTLPTLDEPDRLTLRTLTLVGPLSMPTVPVAAGRLVENSSPR